MRLTNRIPDWLECLHTFGRPSCSLLAPFRISQGIGVCGTGSVRGSEIRSQPKSGVLTRLGWGSKFDLEFSNLARAGNLRALTRRRASKFRNSSSLAQPIFEIRLGHAGPRNSTLAHPASAIFEIQLAGPRNSTVPRVCERTSLIFEIHLAHA